MLAAVNIVYFCLFLPLHSSVFLSGFALPGLLVSVFVWTCEERPFQN